MARGSTQSSRTLAIFIWMDTIGFVCNDCKRDTRAGHIGFKQPEPGTLCFKRRADDDHDIEREIKAKGFKTRDKDSGVACPICPASAAAYKTKIETELKEKDDQAKRLAKVLKEAKEAKAKRDEFEKKRLKELEDAINHWKKAETQREKDKGKK